MSAMLRDIKIENIYLAAALTFGLLFVFINPPFTGVPDEGAHFFKAWSVANGQLKCTGHDAIPKTAAELPDKIQPVKIQKIDGKKISGSKMKDALLAKDSGETQMIGGIICGAVPFGYISPAIGLNIGRLLHFSPLLDFYLARLFNLLLAVFLTYWAIRIIPFGKIIFLLVALLPITIQQFASLSYDALHISLIFLFTAYILKIAVSKETKITKKEIIILLLLSFVGLNVKTGYFALSLLAFIIPASKFENRKQYWVFMTGIVALNIAAFFAIGRIFSDIGALAKGVDPQAQLQHVISNPVAFAYLAGKTLYKKIIFFVETFIYKPGWMDYSLSYLFYLLTIFGMIIFARNEEEKVELDKKQRLILLGVFLAVFFMAFLSLYMVWNKAGSDNTIAGMQGRYFLSIFPLFILSFYKSKFSFKFEFVKKHTRELLVIFYVIIFIFVFQKIYSVYYDKTPKEIKNTSQSEK